MGWYKEGKVNVVAGQTSVTGVGTNFAANSLVGDAFIGPDGQWYEVINVPSPTTLSISPAYRSATVSNANYALMPVQGYQRDLAIVAGGIIQQWGVTLAGLGTVSTENIVPVTKGGTGSSTQAGGRANLGLRSAAVADVVGLVSSGDIIEGGSNANGSFVKFADGTMIQRGATTVTPDSPIVNFYGTTSGTMYYKNAEVTLPTGFFNSSFTIVACIQDRGAVGVATPNGAAAAAIQIRNTSTTVTSTAHWIAIGRWKS